MIADYCQQIRIAAMVLEDGEAPAIEREAVAEHLRRCHACRDAVGVS